MKLINKKLQEKKKEKFKWESMKKEYHLEWIEGKKKEKGSLTLQCKNAIVLKQKCQYQIDCCNEWIDFLTKLKKKEIKI